MIKLIIKIVDQIENCLKSSYFYIYGFNKLDILFILILKRIGLSKMPILKVFISKDNKVTDKNKINKIYKISTKFKILKINKSQKIYKD